MRKTIQPPAGWYLIHSDGRVVDNPKDWITVPDEAMPAVRFIIEEVERDERLHRQTGGNRGAEQTGKK